MRVGDVVEVEWDDHALHMGEYGSGGTAKQRSVGYFVRQDDSIIALAQSITDGKPNDVLVVDKRMLTKTRKVR